MDCKKQVNIYYSKNQQQFVAGFVGYYIEPNHTAPVTQKILKKVIAASLNPLSSPLEILPKIMHKIKEIMEIIKNIARKFIFFLL